MYEMLINIILIHISIIFFYNICIFLIINKHFFVCYNSKFMKFLKYNIDSQSFENLYIFNILNTSYISNYILQCAAKILYFFLHILEIGSTWN